MGTKQTEHNVLGRPGDFDKPLKRLTCHFTSIWWNLCSTQRCL